MRETFAVGGSKPGHVTNTPYRESLSVEFIEKGVEEREGRERLGWGERGETEAEGERQERERKKVASSEKTAERKRVGVDRVFLLKRPFASTYRLRLNRSGYCLGASYQMTRQASMQLKFNCTYM